MGGGVIAHSTSLILCCRTLRPHHLQPGPQTSTPALLPPGPHLLLRPRGGFPWTFLCPLRRGRPSLQGRPPSPAPHALSMPASLPTCREWVSRHPCLDHPPPGCPMAPPPRTGPPSPPRRQRPLLPAILSPFLSGARAHGSDAAWEGPPYRLSDVSRNSYTEALTPSTPGWDSVWREGT